MKRIYLIIAILVAATYQQTNAQGCVAIKGIGGICKRPWEGGSWYLEINNRYLKSYKHFVGTVEQKQREEEGSNVINHSYELDITATRTINLRWSVAMTLPIMSFKRTSLYEHDGKTRHETGSFGIGDARFSGYRWMFDPKTSHKGNIQLGL